MYYVHLYRSTPPPTPPRSEGKVAFTPTEGRVARTPLRKKSASKTTGTTPSGAANEFDCISGFFCELNKLWLPEDTQQKPAESRLTIEALQDYLDKQDEKLRSNVKAAYGVFSKGSKDRRTIIEQAFAAGVLFVDPDFPPSMNSIFKVDNLAALKGDDVIEGEQILTEPPMVEWRRTNEYIEGDICLFGEHIKFDEVVLGQLGNSWLICALVGVSQVEQLVRDLIPELQCNPQTGLYVVRLCKDGSWKTITLDSFIPCMPQKGPIYSRTTNNTLWVSLIEKAFAKYHGSYQSIRHGWYHEAMIDLTGAPYLQIYFQDTATQNAVADGSLWTKLKDYCSKHYIISLTVDANGENVERALIPGYAYSLVDVIEFNDHKVCKVLNLWGPLDLRGDWGFLSPLWTEEAKEALKYTDENKEKFFWVSFDDICRIFDGINIAMVRKACLDTIPWKEERKSVDYKFRSDGSGIESVTMYKMILAGDGAEMYASIHQPDMRRIDALMYFDFGITILKETTTRGEYRCVGSCGNAVERQSQINFLPGTIPSGTFYLVPTTTGCRVNAEKQKILKSGRELDPSALIRQAVVSIHCE